MSDRNRKSGVRRNQAATLFTFVRILTCGSILAIAAAAQPAKIVINDRWPIQGPKGSVLSPPHVEATNECSKSVYVDSFVPHATVTVFIGGGTVIGSLVTEFGFAAVPLTQVLHTGDKITATQTVNGVTSQQSSPPMTVGQMPAALPRPTIDPMIYACGRTVPVHNLVPGVTVEVRDQTAGATVIGTSATPNLWGSDWAPVFTSPLVKSHLITATQSACTGVKSTAAAAVPVQPEPSPLLAPVLDTPIVGNDAITAHGLDTGSVLKAFQGGPIGSGITTAQANWMHVAPPVQADPPAPGVTAEQDLCTHSPQSPPATPTTRIPAPSVVGPICPGQPAAIVRDTTINATLVLLKNNVVVGYGGAGPGDVPLDIVPPAAFSQNDTVQVVEYIGSNVVFSNTVNVGCTSTITYHNDPQRTGWNSSENTLTPANVRPATFGLIAKVVLDDQVDTQPLVVTNQTIEGEGVHTVVYAATEGNTVYALDSWSGAVLRTVNLGPPVPTPLGCGNNGPNVGINGTPTIDLRTRTMYVVAYTLVSGKPVYRLHALDLRTLADKPGSPKTIAGAHALANGTTFSFDAAVQRQRSALVLANGNVYAAFASFCDFRANQSRGWLFGWNAANLNPLGANELTNRLATSPTPFFLSSIWMSGYGVAADSGGSLFFVTGNSDFAGNTYTGTTNIQESVVKMPANLSTVSDLFTPSNVFPLDQADLDYGSGGVMVLPDQPGNLPHLAVAAGKDGRLFILNRDSMGGFHTPDIPKNVAVGECWCGPTYFRGSDGIGRVVSSGGLQAKTWTVNTAVSPALVAEASAPSLPSGAQDGGFFTSVSSNGTNAGTAIIWAIGRPTGSDNHVTLYAFDGTASGGGLAQLWSERAGMWPNTGGNANLVPTVANARVYVPSYRELDIFGLTGRRKPFPPPRRELISQAPPAPPTPKRAGAGYWGTIRSVEGARVTVALRTGRVLQVDLTAAMKAGTATVPVVGRNVGVTGTIDSSGVLRAETMWRAKAAASWGADTPK